MNQNTVEWIRRIWITAAILLMAAGFGLSFYMLLHGVTESGYAALVGLKTVYWLFASAAIVAAAWRIAKALRRPDQT